MAGATSLGVHVAALLLLGVWSNVSAILSGVSGGTGGTGAPKNPNCSFHAHGREYDLGHLRGATFTTRNLSSTSWYNLAVCGNLQHSCVDSLTGVKINGSVYSFFGSADSSGGKGAEPKSEHCWDTLANSTDGQYAAIADPSVSGFWVNFTRPFDAHLGCPEVDVNTKCLCDRGAPFGGHMTGGQVQSVCTWNFQIRDRRFCVASAD